MGTLKFKRNQKGVVLITALIMIMAVTGIAVSLMSNSSIDLKISAAAQESDKAANLLKGDSERSINQEIDKKALSRFLFMKGQFTSAGDEINMSESSLHSVVNLYDENKGPMLLDCPPRIAVTIGVKCNTLRVQAKMKYGKGNKHDIVLQSGIAQQLGLVGKSL